METTVVAQGLLPLKSGPWLQGTRHKRSKMDEDAYEWDDIYSADARLTHGKDEKTGEDEDDEERG